MRQYNLRSNNKTWHMLFGALWLLLFSHWAMADTDFLPPDKAFSYHLSTEDDGTVLVTWEIVPDYYLYKHQFSITDESGEEVPQEWPEGEFIEDEFFGRSEVYFNEVTAKVEPGDATQLRLTWQGCAAAGLCYPPQDATVDIPAPGAGGGLSALFGGGKASSSTSSPTSSAQESQTTSTVKETPQAQDERLAQALGERSFFWAVAAFFGLGILLIFTPCVLPMLPVLSSLVVGSESSSRSQAFTLSLAYVVPMALTYAVMGVIAAMVGANLQAMLQQPAVLYSFAAVFVLLAAAMFGLYELQLPAWLRDRLNAVSQKQRGGTLVGAALMGVLSAILVGPCMTAPLAGALLYIAESGDLWFGGTALFALGLGMGAPLILAMTVGAGFLPKPGAWMDGVKTVFGFMLLGLAIWFLERVLPGATVLALSGLLGLAVAYALWQLGHEAQRGTSPVGHVARATALGVGLWSVLMVLGGAAGNKSPFQPLAGLSAPASQGAAATQANFMDNFITMDTMADFERELEAAQQEGRWVLVDYYADWCISCHVIEREVFGNLEVQQALQDMVLLRPDVTEYDDESKAIMAKYNIMGPPTLLFIGPEGEERRAQRIVGELSAKEFLTQLMKAKES